MKKRKERMVYIYIVSSIPYKINMSEILTFEKREDFRTWLQENVLSSDGVWLVFGKPGGPKTIKASAALEEALCFGWIDGQMQSIDDKTYQKYFSLRRKDSKWSEKNKGLVEQLEKQGMMTDYGRDKIKEAKENGQWDAPKSPEITEEQIMFLSGLLQGHEPAYTHFQAMSPSVKKTYTKGYFAAKTEEGREKRLSWMIARLNQNLKPM